MLHPRAQGSSSGLRGLLLRVWTLADGRRSPEAIADALGAPAEQVRDALDLLDHAGLVLQPEGAHALAELPAWLLDRTAPAATAGWTRIDAVRRLTAAGLPGSIPAGRRCPGQGGTRCVVACC